MNTIRHILLSTIILIIYNSCITILYPFVTFQNIITDEKIQGAWKYKDILYSIGKIPDSVLRKIVTTRKGLRRHNDSILYYNSYNVDFTKNGIGYQYNLELTKIRNKIYIDLGPAGFEPQISHDIWEKKYGEKMEYLPSYSVARLEIPNKNTLVINFFDGSLIKDLIDQGKIKIKHEENKLFDMFLITASPEELHQFISKYGEDERLYNKKDRIILNRVQ